MKVQAEAPLITLLNPAPDQFPSVPIPKCNGKNAGDCVTNTNTAGITQSFRIGWENLQDTTKFGSKVPSHGFKLRLSHLNTMYIMTPAGAHDTPASFSSHPSTPLPHRDSAFQQHPQELSDLGSYVQSLRPKIWDDVLKAKQIFNKLSTNSINWMTPRNDTI